MPVWRVAGKADLWFLMRYILNTQLAPKIAEDNRWVFERIREVQAEPDGYLDLWAREHYKSTIITFGLSTLEIIRDPEVTIGIFSHNNKIAKDFIRMFKTEFQSNELLKSLYPDVFFADPEKEAPKWSENEGLVVKRRGNPREATIETWGLVDKQPTGKHFAICIYDDVVEEDAVLTDDSIEKANKAWELSLNLGQEHGKVRYVGTRYHHRDTYQKIIESGIATPRIYSCTKEEVWPGTPVLYNRAYLEMKRAGMSDYTWNCQMMCHPKGDASDGFQVEWMKYYERDPYEEASNKNIYITVDPANQKKKNSDYTVMWVIGLGPDKNYYVLDCLRDRLNLTERTDELFRLYKRWRPSVVFYERYGLQADVQHIQYMQNLYSVRFHVEEVGGITKKEDRIRRLIPLFQQGQFWFPEVLPYREKDGGRVIDLIQEFIKSELVQFPLSIHDDMLDALSRIVDPGINVFFPDFADIPRPGDDEPYLRLFRNMKDKYYNESGTTWMSN